MMRASPRRRLLLLPLTGWTLLSGCYAYRAAPSGSLAPGADVRLRLSDAGAGALLESAGMRLRTLEGRLQERRADGALVVLPTDVTTVDGDALPWRKGALAVPAEALAGGEQRTISRKRSWALAAGVAGVFTGVVTFALRSIFGGGGASVSNGPGTPE